MQRPRGKIGHRKRYIDNVEDFGNDLLCVSRAFVTMFHIVRRAKAIGSQLSREEVLGWGGGKTGLLSDRLHTRFRGYKHASRTGVTV